MRNSVIGVILASGEGSRLQSVCEHAGLPKHLLPLLNGETIIGRLRRQLMDVCDHVVCTVPERFEKVHRESLPRDNDNYTVVPVRRDKKFKDEFSALASSIPNESLVVLTMGDLVIGNAQIKRFLELVQYRQDYISVGIRKAETRYPSIAISCASFPKSTLDKLYESSVDPERILPTVLFLFRQWVQHRLRVMRVPIIQNVNTPSDYEKVQCAHFD